MSSLRFGGQWLSGHWDSRERNFELLSAPKTPKPTRPATPTPPATQASGLRPELFGGGSVAAGDTEGGAEVAGSAGVSSFSGGLPTVTVSPNLSLTELSRPAATCT